MAGKLNILTSRLLSLLPKRVQHVYGISEPGHIEYTPLAQNMNADFADTWANLGHWLPVGWFQIALNCVKFETNLPARISRKVTQFIQTGANESQRFHQDELYKYFDKAAKFRNRHLSQTS